ncbi:hypothetical protein CRM22_001516 [Opisthorchis felineus]|uniref:F-box domain-containing protein n=1 Tax=Opisthorchis felineus TaxID=147828 RepID=A0A4S2MAG9_OPIFE|nr:hypothetical protein CRM22_001516 [Opisthorchis felineus]
MKRCLTCPRIGSTRKSKRLRRTLSDPIRRERVGLLGAFEKLPVEIIHRVLSFLNLDDLLSLSRASSQLKVLIEVFVNTSRCLLLRNFREPHSIQYDTCSKHVSQLCETYKKIGLLFKELACDFPICVTTRILERHLSNHMCHSDVDYARGRPEADGPVLPTSMPTGGSRRVPCRFGYLRCPALLLYGHFLREFTSDWSKPHKNKLLRDLFHCCFSENFWRKLTAVVCENPGKDVHSELTLRLFIRRVFLDPAALPQPILVSKSVKPSLSERISVGQLSLHSTSHLEVLSANNRAVRTETNLQSFAVTSSSDSNLSLCQFGEAMNDNQIASTPSSSTSQFFPSHCGYGDVSALPEMPTSAPIITRPSCYTVASQPVRVPSHPQPVWAASQQLLHILSSYPIVHQARILFILYGPMHKGRLMWRTMCENTAADSEQLSACFGELGSVLQNMLEIGAWTPEQTLSVLNEIIVMPDEWLAENVACLLYTSGSRLTSMLIRQKAVTGQVGELAVTLTSLCLVRVKIRSPLTDLVGLLDEACRAVPLSDRRHFLDQLARAFQDVIVDLYETDELEERIEDFSTILRAQAEFMRALMARVYEE